MMHKYIDPKVSIFNIISPAYSTAFHISCLRFLNRFVETSRDTREKILIQTELEEAGFDLLPLKKMLLPQTSASIKDRNDLLQEELDRWSNNYIDVNALVKKLLDAERANRKLREEISGKLAIYYLLLLSGNLTLPT